jgi:hypothetical protein
MTTREQTAILRQPPRNKNPRVDVTPTGQDLISADPVRKLHAIARLLRSLATDCDYTADTLR